MLISAELVFNIDRQISLYGGPALPFPSYFLSVGIVAIVLFVFGLSAGLSAITRKHIRISIIGPILLIAFGVAVALPIESLNSWQAGLPTIVTSAAGIFFISKSKSEFFYVEQLKI